MATYWVSTSGLDSNNGSQSTPFLTVGKADSVAAPGDVIRVKPGIYTAPISTSTAGTFSQPITYMSDSLWGAMINTNSVGGFVWQHSGAYGIIRGFDVTSSAAYGGINANASNIQMIGNRVHDIVGSAANGHGGVDGSASASNVLALGNWVYRMGGYPVLNDFVHNIYLAGPNALFINNVSFQSAGHGLTCYHAATGDIFANNLSFNNLKDGISFSTSPAENGGNNGANFIFVNNILRDNGLYGINENQNANDASNQFLNNCIYNNHINQAYAVNDSGGTQGSVLGIFTNNIFVDSQHINYQLDGSGDYRLKLSSPCIDAGTPLSAPLYDYLGVIRPQGSGYDIGPYEYVPSQANKQGGLSLIGA